MFRMAEQGDGMYSLTVTWLCWPCCCL